jgi:LysM repeat protein
MFTNQRVEVGVVSAGFIACVLAFTGCSSWGSRDVDTSESVSAAAESVAMEEPGDAGSISDEMTATEAAAAGEARMAEEPPASPPPSDLLQPTAPKSYTVQRGDTLWDIASTFLRDPWYWPEVWYINPQVENPHLIYPGDVLALAFGADGRPQIRLQSGGPARLNPRLRTSPLEGPIQTIPYSAIASFLSRPSVLTADEVRRAPHVVALRDHHMMGGTGHEIYVSNLDAVQNARYSVVHVGEPLRDPDDGDLLGYEGIYTATALVTKPGRPAKAMLSDSSRETLEGDRLFSSDMDVPLNFIPRAPRNQVDGRIISVVDGVELIGTYQIVVINRGKRHGIDAGHVLAVDQAGEIVQDRYARSINRTGTGTAFAPSVRLPDERAGTLLIFKSFDRLAYGLVVGASHPMRVADRVRNP